MALMVRWILSLALAGALQLSDISPILTHADGRPGDAHAAQIRLRNQTPAGIVNGTAQLVGPQDPASPISLSIGLAIRDQADLVHYIDTEASHGDYLSQQEFDARYGATAAQVQAVEDWAAAHNLHTSFVSPDGLLIRVQGPVGAIGAALGLTVDLYRRADGSQYYANDRDATVPASLGIATIMGLNDEMRIRSFIQRSSAHAALVPADGYRPSDFRTAYDLSGHGYDGTGQTIGLILWGQPISETDLLSYAAATGDVAMSQGTGPDQVEWIPVNGGSTGTSTATQAEIAMDVENAHGMATHAHLKYYLVPDTCTQDCIASTSDLAQAVAMAANDPTVHVVSASWGGQDPNSAGDAWVIALEASFMHAASVGTTFFFSSGDDGSASGCGGITGCVLPAYPASDPYVVGVGGTSLMTNADSSYQSEAAWGTGTAATPTGSGGGCSDILGRPTYQSASATEQAICAGRGVPDVAADADPATGAVVYFTDPANPGLGTQHSIYGGTSLAAPLWAGMTAVANQYASAQGLQPIGWALPAIYRAAGADDASGSYHDVMSGSNGAYSAGPGWDAVTGLGSPDWFAWVRAIHATAPLTGTTTPSPTIGIPATTSTVQAAPTSSPVTAVPSASSTATETATVQATATRTAEPTPTGSASGVPSATGTVSPSPVGASRSG
jgi:kumamolisin